MSIPIVPEDETVKANKKSQEVIDAELNQLEDLDNQEDDANINNTIAEIKNSPLPVLATDVFETIADIKKKVDNNELKGTELILALQRTGILVNDGDSNDRIDVISYIVKHMERPGKGNTPVDVANKLMNIFRLNVTAHDVLSYYNTSRSELSDIIEKEKALIDSELMEKEEFYRTAVHTNQIVARDLSDLGDYADNAYARGDVKSAITAKKVRLEYIHKYQTGIGKLSPAVGNVTINQRLDITKIIKQIDGMDEIKRDKFVGKVKKELGMEDPQKTIDALFTNV